MPKKGVKLKKQSVSPNKKVVQAKKPSEAKKLAVLFHDTYERLAPSFGYKTRKATQKFKATTPNGKLMIAVATEILAAQPKPKPEKPTDESFEQWFFKMDAKHFIDLTERWNEDKLKIKLKKQTDYDSWFNYFKDLPASQIRMLSSTGQDFLPAEAYSALRRWIDIISNPHRIDKIHQAGLSNANGSDKKKTIAQLALDNDRLGVLKATRDKLAEKLDKGAGNRDTSLLVREMTEVMTQIADYEKRLGPKRETKLGQLLDNMPNAPKSKRPSENGKGARHTSFKTRVTIEDVEG